jgi:protein TonB
MLDVQDSVKMRLVWTGLALFGHAVLLFAMPASTAQAPRLSSPIQVSLLDPAPAPQAETPPAPLPPAPEPPRPRPKPRQAPKPQVEPTPEPISDAPTAEPVAEPAEVAEVAESAPVAASAPETSAASSDSNAAAETSAVVAPVFDAAYLRNPEPPYPPMSKSLREEGRVELRVYVLSDGSAGKVELRKSSGSHRLDESASSTVARWKFKPARRGDKAVDSWVIVPILFDGRKLRGY